MLERNRKIIALAESGMLNVDIAKHVGIKRARVGQILQEEGRQDLCGQSRRVKARPFKGGRPSNGPKRKLPSKEDVRKALSYDETTGEFTWRIRAEVLSRHNRRFAGKKAGGLNKSIGYVQISLNGISYYAHQLAWVYVNGTVPEGMVIDHKNTVKSDNRLKNLRVVTYAENALNTQIS